MAEYIIQDTSLTEIANAIRAKTGASGQLTLENMASQIANMQTSDEPQTCTVQIESYATISTLVYSSYQNGTYEAGGFSNASENGETEATLTNVLCGSSIYIETLGDNNTYSATGGCVLGTNTVSDCFIVAPAEGNMTGVIAITESAAEQYVNQLAIATDASGNIYNGVGYKENTRINSSKVEVEATGWDLTGFIPVHIGDIVRMKNMSFLDMTNTGTSRACIKIYDESYTYLTESTTYTPTTLPTEAWAPIYGTDGNLVQFMIPLSYKSATSYMRICADDINADSIITVNQEITD